MIKILFICHGNIPKRLKNARKIKGFGRLEGTYYALAYDQYEERWERQPDEKLQQQNSRYDK